MNTSDTKVDKTVTKTFFNSHLLCTSKINSQVPCPDQPHWLRICTRFSHHYHEDLWWLEIYVLPIELPDE